MIILKILGYSTLLMLGLIALFHTIKGLYFVANHPTVDAYLNPPIKPYNYSKSELWEPPVYWTNWEKNTTV